MDENTKKKNHIVFVIFIVLACLISSGCFEETEILTAFDGVDPGRHFGYSVDIHMAGGQNYALIGAPDDNTCAQDAGAVYVYRKSAYGDSWQPVQKLYASDAAVGDRFGCAVSIYNNIAVIGSRYDDNSNGRDAGAAYVFRLINGQWYQYQKLIRSNGRANEHFGAAVSIDGIYVFIGSPYAWTENRNQGEVDIYYKGYPSPRLSLVKTIRRAGHHKGGVFGERIAVDGGYAVIGSPTELENGSFCGAIHIYSLQGGWHEVKRIPNPDENIDEKHQFGDSVSIWDDYIIVGSPGSDGLLGAAYIYGPDAAGNPWEKVQRLTVPESAGFWFEFGKTVAMDEGVAIVGAEGSYAKAPAAYVYAYVENGNQGEWTFIKKLEPAHEFQPGGIDISHFADAVAISGDYAIISDPYTRWNECNLPRYCYQTDSLVYMYEKEQQ